MKDYLLACSDFEVQLQDYLDGYLLSSQREELEAHLAKCAECRLELLRMQRLEARLEESRQVDVPADLAAAVASRMPVASRSYPWTGKAFRAVGMAIAFSIGVVLTSVLLYSSRHHLPEGREVEIVFVAPEANSVNVVGDFNDWDLFSHPMRRGDGGRWHLTLRVSPGIYQYTFYVDHRRWAEHPGSRAQVSDGFGGRNAVLYVEG